MKKILFTMLLLIAGITAFSQIRIVDKLATTNLLDDDLFLIYQNSTTYDRSVKWSTIVDGLTSDGIYEFYKEGSGTSTASLSATGDGNFLIGQYGSISGTSSSSCILNSSYGTITNYVHGSIINGSGDISGSGGYSTILNSDIGYFTNSWYSSINNSVSLVADSLEYTTISGNQGDDADEFNDLKYCSFFGNQTLTADGLENCHIFSSQSSDISSSSNFFGANLYDFDVEVSQSAAFYVSSPNFTYLRNCFLFDSNTESSSTSLLGKVLLSAYSVYSDGNDYVGFSAASIGVEFTNSYQSIFGTYNDNKTISGDDKYLDIGNGTADDDRSSVLIAYESGNVVIDAATYVGDSANIVGTLAAGYISNNTNGDLMQWDGSEWQLFNKSCGDYLSSSFLDGVTIETVCTDADTWYLMGYGTTNQLTTKEDQGFTYDGDTLQFIGGGCDSVRFKLTYSISFSATDASEIIYPAMSINDVVDSQSIQECFIRNSNEPYPVSGEAIVWLKPYDKIRPVVKSASSTNTVTTRTMSISLTKV